MLAQPPAASSSAMGQSEPAAVASTSAAETISGKWLIAATAASCSAAPRCKTRAPHAIATAPTRSRAITSGGSDSVTTHGRPTNSPGSAAA